MKNLRLLSLLCCSLLLTSCVFNASSVPDELYESAVRIEKVKKDSLLTALKSRAASLKSARAYLQIAARKGLVKEELSQGIVFIRPDKLRIDMFGTEMNQLVGLLVANGSVIRMKDFVENKSYSLASSEEAISQLLGLPLAPEEIMLWLTGTPILGSDAQIRHNFSENKYILKSIKEDKEITFTFVMAGKDGKFPVIVSSELKSIKSGETLLLCEYEYGGFPEAVSPPGLPTRIVVEKVADGITFDILVNSMSINQIIADTDKIFSLN